MINFQVLKILKPLLIFASAFIIFIIAQAFLKRKFLNKVKSKKMKHTITLFMNFSTYLFLLVGIIFMFFSFGGDWTQMSLVAGLFSVGLGLALQKPITGLAAWFMIIFSNAFKIGDRIIVGTTKGDVDNITLTHIHIKEIGGTVAGDEFSGRIILLPNSILFEKEIINYTRKNNFILDEVNLMITYESDINQAKKMCLENIEKLRKNFKDKLSKKPYLRFNFERSGINIKLKYYIFADKKTEFNSNLTEEIFKQISKEKNVEIAYPHTEVVFRKKEDTFN